MVGNWKAQPFNISDEELDTVVWRYLTFQKFIGMISYGALWFCRLQYLIDEYEGSMPMQALAAMRKENSRWKSVFKEPALHQQIDKWPETNVKDGRSLTAVNCWFIGENESEFMWNEYVRSSEGMAIKSTIRKVRDSVYLPPEVSFVGKVEYVDLKSYRMPLHEAAQAHRRAFLKEASKFSQEKEMRLSTMNIKTHACLSSMGIPLKDKDLEGKFANNFDEAGLYVRVDLRNLFDTIVLAPNAPDWFKNLTNHIALKANLGWVVKDSELAPKI